MTTGASAAVAVPERANVNIGISPCNHVPLNQAGEGQRVQGFISANRRNQSVARGIVGFFWRDGYEKAALGEDGLDPPKAGGQPTYATLS